MATWFWFPSWLYWIIYLFVAIFFFGEHIEVVQCYIQFAISFIRNWLASDKTADFSKWEIGMTSAKEEREKQDDGRQGNINFTAMPQLFSTIFMIQWCCCFCWWRMTKFFILCTSASLQAMHISFITLFFFFIIYGCMFVFVNFFLFIHIVFVPYDDHRMV